ncbi:TonB-dependent receptor [Chitinophagaceae bacterium LB-8]|uniref:TonB-dependent receptor n=1 Tax=Paraflavisolibacter caeni TaxID=2982496 RepID=A0A9X2XPH2_9BACT|nr:TonB-dependent receptor [Paraflavisolibacter caeni]MCU7551323.1 TonB-dependent receptor [Paraflavisolibacter caeni]
MRKKNAIIVAAIIGSNIAQAQTESQAGLQDTAKSLNEIVVTANKFPQKQSTTGKVITVINKEQIEKSSGRTVAQLLNEQAGLTINGALNNLGSAQTVFMRGASAGRTLILIDGMPVYDPSLINSEFDLNLLSLNTVERIEICRGAQSTLYGSDAVAGVINIITVKQDISKPLGVKATAVGGNLGLFRGNVQAYGKTGRFIYNARYARLSSNGFSSAYDSTGKGNFENDGYKGNVAQASVQFAASEALTFRTFAQLSQNKTDLDASSFTDERDFTVKNNNKMAGAGFRFNKNNITLVGNYQYSQIDRNFLNDSLYQDSYEKYATNDYFGKSQFVELYATIPLSGRFRLLQGADYRLSSMNSSYLSMSSFGSYSGTANDSSHSQASLYASLFYGSINERLNVELGGRLNVHSRYGSNQTFTFNPSYQVCEHFRMFGSIASAFKAPTLFQLNYNSSIGKEVLRPEESTTYEVGVQQLHSKVQSRLVFFHRNVNNGIDFNNNDYYYFNFLKQKVNGIELETRVQPVQNLNITANYTFLDGEETTQSRETFNDSTYQYLLRRPKHNINLTAGYSFENSLYVSLSGKYVSKRFDVGGYKTNDVSLDSYFLLNAYAEFKPKSWLKVFADAQNITDKKFFDVWGYNSIPFTVQAGLTVEF